MKELKCSICRTVFMRIQGEHSEEVEKETCSECVITMRDKDAAQSKRLADFKGPRSNRGNVHGVNVHTNNYRGGKDGS